MGYIQQESSVNFAISLKNVLRGSEVEKLDEAIKKISIHDQTIKHDIYLLLNPLIQIQTSKKLWKAVFLKLVENGKIPRAKLLQTIMELDLSGDKLSAIGTSYRQIEIGVLSWIYDILKSIKPENNELLSIQNRLLEVLDTEFSTVKKISLGLLKKIAKDPSFNKRVFLEKVNNNLPNANFTQAKLILSILGIMKKNSDSEKIIVVVKKGLKNSDKKVLIEIQKFLEKFADKATADAVKSELEQKEQPKVLTADDLGGWTEEEIKKISQLLLSVEDASVKVAFALLENRAFPKILLSEIFAIRKLTDDKGLAKIADAIIRENGSNEVISLLGRKLSLGKESGRNAPTEKTIKKNIHTYINGNELDGLKIAQALFKKDGIGVSYLLDESNEENKKEIFQNFITGTSLKLTGVALTKFPPIIFEFPELTSIDLSENKIGSIPAKINNFKQLKFLKLNTNRLKSIHKNIASLKNLEELDLSHNIIKGGLPAHLFELINLKKLNLSGALDGKKVHEISMKILNLKKLESFKLDLARTYLIPNNHSNYPQINEVTGNPINMEPLAIAETAFSQGDISPASYIFEHGDTKLRKSVLDYFYDKNTKRMDFSRHLISGLPEEILSYDIEILNLHGCGMEMNSFPKKGVIAAKTITNTDLIAKMRNLKKLNLGRNKLTALADLSSLTNLTHLVIKSMDLSELFDLTPLKNLKEINLDYLRLTTLPKGIFTLTNLTHLELSGAFRGLKDKFKTKDFEPIKNLTNLKKLTVDFYQFRNKREYEQVKGFLPQGCEYKDY